MVIDIILALVSIALAYSLIPQVFLGFRLKQKLITTQTSLITVIGMYIISFCYFILNLYFSSIVSLITGSLWLVLFVQGLNYKHNKHI
jgi:hypothetical protein